MLIDALFSVALYCGRCGSVHIEDVTAFSGGETGLYCSVCGEKIGEAVVRPGTGLTLSLTCGSCASHLELSYSLKELSRLRFEKLYCPHERFELGYIGKRRELEEFLHFNEGRGDTRVLKHDQLLLEALARVHELAERGELLCPCGSQAVKAGILGESLLLECQECASYCVLPIHTSEDLTDLAVRLAGAWRFKSYL